MRYFSAVFIFIVIVGCEKNDDFRFSDTSYPSGYCLINESQKQNLRELFNDENYYYMIVDSFGFLGYDQTIQLEPSLFTGIINDQDSVLIMAKTFIAENSELTGVNDTSLLAVKKISGFWSSYGSKYLQKSDIDRNRWFIRFKNQLVEGIEVEGSEIGIYVSPKGVYRMFGHWFPYVYVPQSDFIHYTKAQEMLIGSTFEYFDWGGHQTITITEDTFYPGEIPVKKIFPCRNGNCIELRLCWVIPSKSVWNFYCDVLTGELIFKEQIIVF